MTSVEIRALRTKLRMTRRDLARCVNTKPDNIARWEHGMSTPTPRTVSTLKRIAYLSDHLLARRANPDWSL